MKLHNIGKKYEEAQINLELMVERGDIDQECLKDTLESLRIETKEDIQEYCKYIDNQEIFSEALKIKEDQLKKRRFAIKKQIEYMKSHISKKMLELNIKNAGETVSLKKKVPSVEIFDESLIPEKFVLPKTRTYKVIDKLGIKDELKKGHEVPGSKLGLPYKLVII